MYKTEYYKLPKKERSRFERLTKTLNIVNKLN